MAAPRVSVILPTYNRGSLLTEAVRSVVAQSWKDWELIVVDDGSTDDSLGVIRALADPRIRIHSIPHSGSPAAARNAGIDEAAGEWIAFLDSDDVWLPSKLDRQLQELENRDAAWSTTGFAFIDDAGAPTHQRSGKPYRAQSGWVFDRMVAGDTIATIQAVIVRRTLLDVVGRFEEALVSREDLDLMLRLALEASIAAVPETLTLIREHEGRTTKSCSTADLLEANAVVFSRAAMRARDARQRGACRRLGARNRIAKARVVSHAGEHRAAFAALVEAAKDDPTSPLLWRVAAGCVARGVLRRGNDQT